MRKVLFIALPLLAVAALLAVLMRSDLPGALAGSERGFADTVLRYRDRSYEGAQWKLFQDARADRLYAVAGWDDANFWIASEDGRISRQKDGLWQNLGKVEGGGEPSLRCADRETLFVAGNSRVGDNRLCRVDAAGTADLGSVYNRNALLYGVEICPLAKDLLYCFRSDYGNVGAGDYPGTLHFAGGQRTEMPEGKYRESFVHTADGSPIREHPVRFARFTAAFAPGDAFALSPPNGEAPHQGRSYTLARFRSGTWYEVADLKFPTADGFGRRVGAAWITGRADSPTVFLVGEQGWVQIHEIGKSKVDQPVAVPASATSMNLIRVWGVSAAKYWVMDDSGTVWERSGNESRVAVRGLFQNDVRFRAAWVAPTGAVFAITETQLYRLK